MRYKRWIVLILIVLFLIPVNMFFVPDVSAAGWWDSDWSYFKTVEVGDKIDDYSMKLVVEYNTGLDVSANISLEGHGGQTDFDDIRFVYDNSTVLSYWMENYTDSISAVFWVNNSGNYSSFDMFYGNVVVGNVSNGDDVFMWFDNFSGVALDTNKWENDWSWGGGGTVAVSGGYLSLTVAGKGEGIRSHNGSGVKTFTPPYMVRGRTEIDTSNNYFAMYDYAEYGNPSQTAAVQAGFANRINTEITIEDGSYDTIIWDETDFQIYEFRRANNNNDFYINDILVDNDHDSWDGDPAFIDIATYAGTDTFNVDWVFLSLYNIVTPYWSSFGSETSSAPANNPPTFSNLDPADGETGVELDVGGIWVDINDVDGDGFNYDWACSDGSHNSAIGNSNGSKYFMFDYGDLDCGTLYTWWVNATDGTDYTNSSFNFTTVDCVINPYVVNPNNNSVDVCPCSDCICVDVDANYNFNITVYGRGSFESNYSIWDTYVDVSADEYCFCLCGYIVDSWHQPMRYNITYYWYVNVSKFDDSNVFNVSDVYNFMTASDCDDCSSSGGGGGSMSNSTMGVVGVIGIFGLLGFILNRRRRRGVG